MSEIDEDFRPPTEDEVEKQQREGVDSIFGDDIEPNPTPDNDDPEPNINLDPEPEPEPEPEPTPEPDPDKDNEDELDPTAGEEGEEHDFDKKLDTPEPKKDDEEGEEEGEEAKQDGNPLRPQLAEKGKQVKVLTAEKQELALEVDRLKEENEALKNQVDTVEASNVDVANHPEVQAIAQTVRNNAKSLTRRLKGGHRETFQQVASTLLDKYYQAEKAPEQEQDHDFDALKREIYNKFNDDGIELDEDEDVPYDTTAERVFDFLEENYKIVEKANDKKAEIESRAKNKTLAVGVETYSKRAQEFNKVLEPLGSLPDEVIEQNPHTPEAAVAKIIRDSKEGKKRAEAAKAVIRDAFLGKEPLSQEQIDKFVANFEGEGDALQDFKKKRAVTETSIRDKMAVKLFQGLMLLSGYEDMSKSHNSYKTKADEVDEELDALDGVTRTKKGFDPVKEDVRPKDKPSAVVGLLDELF